MAMLTQEQAAKTINPLECRDVTMPMPKLREQWVGANKTSLEQKTEQGNNTRGQRAAKYVKRSGETEISNLIERHPVRPEELDIDENDRKKLGEIIIESPTGNRREENGRRDVEQQEQRR